MTDPTNLRIKPVESDDLAAIGTVSRCLIKAEQALVRLEATLADMVELDQHAEWHPGQEKLWSDLKYQARLIMEEIA